MFSCYPSTIAGIDIGSGFIKAAELSFLKKKPVLKAVGIAATPPEFIKDGQISDVQDLTEVLVGLWKNGRLTCRDAVTAIDGRSIFVREVVLPHLNPEEINEAVKWNQKEHIPFEENTYYYDFAIIDSGKTGLTDSGCRILLAAAPIKAVDDIVNLLKMVNCQVWAVDIGHLAASGTFEFYSSGADTFNTVVDIGNTHSKIILFKGNIPVFNRIIPLGGEVATKIIMSKTGLDFAGAEKFKLKPNEPDLFLEKRSYFDWCVKYFAADLAGEVKNAIEYYFARNSQPKCIYLTGGGAGLKNLAENMAAEIGQTPVKVHNPLSCIEISPLIDKNYLNGIAPQLTVAIGLALRGGEL